MKINMLLIGLLFTAVVFPACQSKTTKIVTIRYADGDTITQVKFRATINTGEELKIVEEVTPYTIEFTDQSFVLTAYPQADSVNLVMESWDKNLRSSRVTGWAHSGTIYYIKPNGGPGYVGGNK